MPDPNLDQLIAAADALRPLLPELVFVGGCVTGLLITDEAAGEPRVTIDVDAIAEIKSYSQYAEFGDACAVSASVRTPERVRLFADGFGPELLSTSCRSTKRFWDSRIAGTKQQWERP